MYRDHTKVIQIGDRKIGGGNPILIQSMTNTKTEDVEQTVAQILAEQRLHRFMRWRRPAVILSVVQYRLWKLQKH